MRSLISLLAPTTCAGCGCEMRPQQLVCGRCARALDKLAPGPCSGGPATLSRDPAVSRANRQSANRSDRALCEWHSAFEYEGVARELVSRFKFKLGYALADHLAELMLRYLPPCGLERNGASSYLVPVPVHPQRRRSRGFNQAQLLAEALGRRLSIPVFDCLERRGSPIPQHEASNAERRSLPENAVVIKDPARSLLDDRLKRVWLLDDVVTTGATLEVCASALKQGGASRIGAVTFAGTNARVGYPNRG